MKYKSKAISITKNKNAYGYSHGQMSAIKHVKEP